MHHKKVLVSALCISCSFLLSACSRKKSETSINSDATRATIITQDLKPLKLAGAKSLTIQNPNSYLSDDGMQQISIPAGTASGKIIEKIFDYLDNYPTIDNPQLLSIKQASINVAGAQLSLLGGSGLLLHSKGIHSKLSSSGDALIISADPQKAGVSSYLLVSETNPEHYSIQDPNDRYSPGLFNIAKQSYTLLKINRNSDIDNPTLLYQTGETSNEFSAYGGMHAIPDTTPLTLKIPYKNPETPVLVLHVTNDPLSSYRVTQDCEKLLKDIPAGTLEHLKQNFSGRNTLASCDLLTANSSGEYQFTTKKLLGSGDISFQQGLIIVSPAHSKMISWWYPKFSPTLVDTEEYNFPYIKNIVSDYQLDYESLYNSLATILSTGAFESRGNGFRYKIQAQKTYEGTLDITTIFGQKKQVPLKLFIESIDPRVITKEVLANNTISILPQTGSFQDVLIQHMNTGSFEVSFSPCEITNNVDRSRNNGQGLENYLFNCDDARFKTSVTTKDFMYRKAYRTAVSLPQDFPSAQAFKVSIPTIDGSSQEHFFYKSNIGIRSKVAGEKLRLRGFLFDDNSAIQSGTLTVQTIGNLQETLMTKTINQSEIVIDLPKDENNNIKNDLLLITLTHGDESSFLIVDPLRSSSHYRESSQKSYTINSYLNPQDVVNSNNNLSFRGEEYPVKIYGYSDRGLYKAGDSVYVAGFVRDLRNFKTLDYLKGKTVTLTMQDPQGNQLYNNEKLELDDFGGFKASMPLPTSMALGDLVITYRLNSDERVFYGHNIKVEEYQKPTFYIDTSHSAQDGNISLITKPNYYFGQALNNYNIKINRSLAGKDICAYCRRWNQENYYYNYVFNDTISTGGDIALYNQTAEQLNTPLFPSNLLKQKGYQYSLKANITIKDNNSDETQFFTRYIDFNPGVKLGLSGQPYEWLYNENGKDTRKDFSIDTEIKEGKDLIKNLHYQVLYWSYDQALQQGVDGNSYYLNGNQYLPLSSGDLNIQTNGSIPTHFITKPGSYLLRVYAHDEQGNIIGEVQKQIEYYEFSNDPDGLLGALPNNYTLTVNIPKKTYEEGETIPVDIAPYQKGARVLIHVERGNEIIETIEKTLDGSPLTLTVKPGYAPNIVVNVMQMIGTDKSSSPRKEPRFLVGYGQAEISTAMHTMQIDIKTDKAVYKPNEEVKVSISTKDSSGNPIDARVSLGVIDEALMAMYDAKKEPIPYFFNKLGTSIANYTNMKLLYQSLRAFANNGSKGGGGAGGKASFSVIRDDLEDIAFWRGAIYTTGGKAELSFTVPENLTTRVIDTIAISKNTRLGTAQKSFKVSKNLVIEANPPGFVTIGDQLSIPVKVIVAPEIYKKDSMVKGYAKLLGGSGETLELGNFEAPANSKVLLDTSIPQSRLGSNKVHLIIEGSYDNEQDSIQQTIPLRTEGLLMKESIAVINSAGDHSFSFPEYHNISGTMMMSQFPTNFIDPMIQYLSSYPYGCTEQLLSSMLPLVAAQKLKDTGKFQSYSLQEKFVETSNGTINIDAFFADGISQILSRQNSNGSFGLWKKDESSASIAQYTLSSYVYAALLQLKSKSPSPATVSQALKQASDYLRTHRTLSPEGFLYYLSQKTLYGETLNSTEQAELATMKPQSLKYGALLRYAIAAGQKQDKDLDYRRLLAIVPTNDDERRAESLFLNQTTAYALKLQALSKDSSATQEGISETLQALISLRNNEGLRGSTQNNVQVTLALSSIAAQWPHKESIACNVESNGKQMNITLHSASGSTRTLPNPQEQQHSSVKRSCESPVFADIRYSYIPKNLSDQLGADSHVTAMQYSISDPEAQIGETVDITASWTTTLPGEQVAVEIFIPSTLKFVNTINIGQYQPFTISDYNCQPSHRETKFDRLFLYYDSLQAITCDMTIPALKAYEGISTIQPMRVYEMYRGKVNGRKIIQ